MITNISKWSVLAKLVFIGIFYQAQHYGNDYIAFGFIASSSNMLEETNVSNLEYSILSGPAMLAVSALSMMPLSRISDYATRPK